VPVAFGAPTFIRRRNVRFVWIVNSRRWWHSAIKSRFRALISIVCVCVCLMYKERSPRVNKRCARVLYLCRCVSLLIFFVIEEKMRYECSYRRKKRKKASHTQKKKRKLLFLSTTHIKKKSHRHINLYRRKDKKHGL